MTTALNHLKEIDGLRAVAVMSVLLFHVEYPWITGGFVGVDVFFVISGFLISRIIMTELDAGDFSVARFYERRIRRIAPALFATLIGCTAFLVVLPPSESLATRNALLAGLFSASNFWFHTTTDYFRDNSLNPLLHTWSLSVEEQFYIALPPALWLISRYARSFRRSFVVAALLASAVSAEWVVRENASAAFYLPWLRAWELLAGTLLATAAPEKLGRPLRMAMTHAGLAMIVAACLLYEKTLRFPGWSALLPVLGSCAVIAGAGVASPANWLLGTAPMRFLGKISYSLYLVHWPLVCFVAGLHGLTPKARLVIIVISIALAWLSWRFVENPFRKSGDAAARQRLFRGFGVAVAAMTAAAVLIAVAGRLLWQRFPEAVTYAANLDSRRAEFDRNPCWIKGKNVDVAAFAASGCLTLSAERRNVLLIGDSHAAHLVSALREAHPEIQLLNFSRNNCRPFPDARSLGDPVCTALLTHIFERWLPTEGSALDTIVLSARWQPDDLSSLRSTVTELEKAGKNIVVIGPSPEFQVMVPLMLAYGSILSQDLGGRLVRPDSFMLEKAMAADPVIAPHYFSLLARLCPDGVCQSAHNRIPNFSDRDHLTVSGARIALQGLTP